MGSSQLHQGFDGADPSRLLFWATKEPQAGPGKVECANVNCHNVFTPKNAQHGFCSQACRRAARRTEWKFICEVALMRDHDTCQDCHDTNCPLEVHHITPLCKGGDNKLTNLTSLCKPCHRLRHRTWKQSVMKEAA
jgi:5-methylcytosine-specific restriction endonuclease McrA